MEEKKSIKKKNKNWWIVLVVVVVILFTVAPYGVAFVGLMMFDGHTYTKFEEVNGVVNVDNKIKIYGVEEIVDNKDEFYLQGYLENTSSKTINNITVKYNLYDKDGTIIGDSSTYLEELGKGKKWKFKITYEEYDSSEVTSYKLAKIDIN